MKKQGIFLNRAFFIKLFLQHQKERDNKGKALISYFKESIAHHRSIGVNLSQEDDSQYADPGLTIAPTASSLSRIFPK